MVAGPKDEANSRLLRSALSPNHEVRSSTCPASTQLLRPPPPQPQMIVGPWPAPSAVLILVLYESFGNSVYFSCEPEFAALKRLTLSSRTVCWGCPDRNQYEAAPPVVPPPAAA